MNQEGEEEEPKQSQEMADKCSSGWLRDRGYGSGGWKRRAKRGQMFHVWTIDGANLHVEPKKEKM